MAAICTDLVELIAERQFASAALFSAFGLNSVGIFSSSMNQLGLGVMLSTILILVPPMAGAWFNGVMASTYGNNHFGGWNGAPAGAPGSGAGSGAHGMPAYGNQQQSVNYQNNAAQSHSQSDDATRRITRGIAINSEQASNPTTSPANSLVGAGNRTRQSEPNNNGGNTNDQA